MSSRTFLLVALLAALATAHAAEPEYREPEFKSEQRRHWAFQPMERVQLPIVRHSAWVRSPIDAFVLAKLEEQGLSTSPETDRRVWLRRVSFDLIGLPPTIAEQDAFLSDHSSNAYEKVVDRLLASPHYGERWAQHWLDVVRYAESDGYEADTERVHAWRYRDYVVQSFAKDKPYDQFLREQIAGDILSKDRTIGRNWYSLYIPDPASIEFHVAVGLHRCGPMHFISGNVDAEVVRQEIVTEMVNGLGSAVLGLTIGCARCHDHKFDPISQGDYYRLQAFFAATQLKERDYSTAVEKDVHQKAVGEIQKKIAPLRAQETALEIPYRAKISERKKAALDKKYVEAMAIPEAKRTPAQKLLVEHAAILLKITWDEVLAALSPEDRAKRQAWRNEIHALEAQMPPPPTAAWTVAEDVKVPPTHVLKRGEVKTKLSVVPPGFLSVLKNHDTLPRGSRNRLDLAKWITDPKHPLTARVWVNRIWQHHFGRGIVATPNDFGLRGEKPTHPELLDWLAGELIRNNWSTKAMHRLMVLSATYRQSSRGTPTSDNRLWARMNRRRLEAENLRDAMLATAGTLNPAIGGPPVRIPLEPEVYDLIFTEAEPDGLWKVTPDVRQHARRSLYLLAKRNVRQPLLEAFDQPDTLNPCPARPVSTFAPQALILMNGPIAQAQSKAFASRLLREVGPNAGAAIDRAYGLALGRPPRADERHVAETFLADQTHLLRERMAARQTVNAPADMPMGVDPAAAAALVDFCLAVFNLNEFVYVD